MRQQEREYLTAVINELVNIREDAPTKAIYTQGRTDGAIAYRIGDVIEMLADVVDDERTTATDD